MALITVQELSDYSGLNLAGDNGGTLAVNMASQAVLTTAEQSFTAGTSTITMDGSGTDALLLPELPVANVGSVNIISTSATTAVTDFALGDNGVLLRTRGAAWWRSVPAWPAGRQNVQITYTHGTTVPDDIRMVTLSLANRLIQQGAAVAEGVGDANVRYAGPATDLTDGEKAICRKYRPAR